MANIDFSSASDIISLLSTMGVAGVVGNVSTDSVKLLWKTICDRLQYDSDAKNLIDRVEKDRSEKHLKMLTPCLEEAMQDEKFAAEITQLAQKIANADGTNTNIKQENFTVEDRGIVVGSNHGGINIDNVKK